MSILALTKGAHNDIFEASPTFCVAIDSSGRTLKMNQAMLEALGYERHEVIGKEYMPMSTTSRSCAAGSTPRSRPSSA